MGVGSNPTSDKVFSLNMLHHGLCSTLVPVYPTPRNSRVAQWKRAGPITQRSVDRNHALLKLFFLHTIVQRGHMAWSGQKVQMAEWSKARGSRIRSYPLIGDFSSSHEGGGSNPPLDINIFFARPYLQAYRDGRFIAPSTDTCLRSAVGSASVSYGDYTI